MTAQEYINEGFELKHSVEDLDNEKYNEQLQSAKSVIKREITDPIGNLDD